MLNRNMCQCLLYGHVKCVKHCCYTAPSPVVTDQTTFSRWPLALGIRSRDRLVKWHYFLQLRDKVPDEGKYEDELQPREYLLVMKFSRYLKQYFLHWSWRKRFLKRIQYSLNLNFYSCFLKLRRRKGSFSTSRFKICISHYKASNFKLTFCTSLWVSELLYNLYFKRVGDTNYFEIVFSLVAL